MNREFLFSTANTVALLAWILLIFFPRKAVTRFGVRSGFVSAALSVVYLVIVGIAIMSGAAGGFSSLASLFQLFTNQDWLLAGWVHYLAFDIFLGVWILQDSERKNFSQIYLAAVLFATFMLGPVGYVTYWIVCKYRTRNFHDLFSSRF